MEDSLREEKAVRHGEWKILVSIDQLQWSEAKCATQPEKETELCAAWAVTALEPDVAVSAAWQLSPPGVVTLLRPVAAALCTRRSAACAQLYLPPLHAR